MFRTESTRPRAFVLTSALAAVTSISVAQNAPPAAQPTIAHAAADLPEATEIFDRALAAMGGKERIEAIESTSSMLELNTPMGAVGMKMLWHKSGKMHIEQSLPNNMGQITMGYDGEIGWVHNPFAPGGGYELMPAEQLDEMKGQANILMIVPSISKEFDKFQTIGLETFKERSCYKIRMVDEKGEEGAAYFDEETSFIAGIESQEQGPAGSFPVILSFADWKELDGIKFFRKMVINNAGLDMEMDVKELELNTVSMESFELPEEVKALAANAPPASQPEGDGANLNGNGG